MINNLFDILIIAHSFDDIIFNNLERLIENCSNSIYIFLLDSEIERKEIEYNFITTIGIKLTSNQEDIKIWITESQNNILLLDSQVMISENGLSELLDIFTEDLSIGTISPIIANELESKCESLSDLKNIQKLAIQSSLNLMPKIKEVYKKCLFINRRIFDNDIIFDFSLINDIDLLIDKFTTKIALYGFHNIVCDFFIIYDTQYGKNKKTAKNNEYLCAIYDNINLHLLTDNNKINILYQLHSDFKKNAANNIGGTQLHVKDLVSKLRNSYNLYVVAKDEGSINLTIYLEKKEISFKFSIEEEYENEQFYSKRYKEIYTAIIKSFSIDIIHVQHCLGMTRELFYIGKEMNIPIITSIHDYYYLCPSLLMLDIENNVCIGCEDIDRCVLCMKKRLQNSEGNSYLKFWRSESIKTLDLCDTIIVPSYSVKYNMSQYFPDLKCKINIIEHGIDINPFNIDSFKITKKNFSIAFVGSLGPEKGSRYAYDMIKNSTKDIEWVICGTIQEYPLLNLKQRNLVKLGAYDRENLPEIMKDNAIDLVCILSICPETYSYTLSEVIACGVPVIVMDSGALGERVRNLGCGWIVPQGCNYRDILNVIDEIRLNNKAYNKILNHIKDLKIRNVCDMALDYQKVYDEIYRPVKKYQSYDSKLLYIAYQNANYNKSYIINYNDISLFIEIEKLRNELRRIKNSGAYLLGFRIITKIKKPFKCTIKKLLFWIHNM